ncbi:DNA-processing protein DprA [Oceanivirga miroungae]|uniref:DNA protecting protein DprA n=1 Tax=Oceanivirga miroungae TaxID=1130046 RepID=A0A6I8MA77_9FUSO|nr:DNA-processing protein DprA [Oceanivirga miroungae]VWL85730.1 DNA protecting protein DprA [Oceanivirga miroungae]
MKWEDLICSKLSEDQIRALMLENSSVDELLQKQHLYKDKIKYELEYAYKNSFKIEDKPYKIMSYMDSNYPKYLKEISDFPPYLYYIGNEINIENIVTVSGTRINSQIGKISTEKIVDELSNYEGVSIVNGVSNGIDTIAVKRAISKNIPVIAVIPTNILSFYPYENTYLKDLICENGCIISEIPIEKRIKKEDFIKRNRIIVGLSRAVCITESYIKGKSNILVNYALEYEREIYAIPGSILNKSSELCNKLIMENKAKLVLSADDIASEYAWRKLK